MLKWEPMSDADRESLSTLSTHRVLDKNNTHRISISYGAGIAASSPLAPGSLILKLHMPNLLLVERDSLSKVCSFCMLESQTLKRCSSCKVPYYCKKACQIWHWQEIHSRECSLLKKLPDVPPTAVRALIVMLLRKKKKLEGEEERDWKELESHVVELQRDRKRWEEILLQARAGVEFTKSAPERMEDAIRWLCVLSTNAFRVTLPDNTPVGLCFSPTLARANHSCEPNAFIVFDTRNISLRTLRPIKKDEQIFISYIDPTEATLMRQLKLKERYFFTCKCAKCENNEGPYESFLKYHREVQEGDAAGERMDVLCPQKEFVKAAESCSATLKQNLAIASDTNKFSKTAVLLLEKSRGVNQPYRKERISYLRKAVNSCSPMTDNHIFALAPYPEILHELYLAYVDSQAFMFALITLLFLFLNSDVFIFPQSHHPVRVVRMYTVAKLLKHIASLSSTELLQDVSQINSSSASATLQANEEVAKAVQSMDLINAFHAILILVWEEAKKSHGEDSVFMKEVKQEVEEVEEVQRLRGLVGGKLRKWMGDKEDVDGRKEAEKCLGDLKRLTGLIEKVIAS